MKLSLLKHFCVNVILRHSQNDCMGVEEYDFIFIRAWLCLRHKMSDIVHENRTWLTWIWRSRFFLTNESAISPKMIYHPYFCKNTTENMYPSELFSIIKAPQVTLFTCNRCCHWVLVRSHVGIDFRSGVRHFWNSRILTKVQSLKEGHFPNEK